MLTVPVRQVNLTGDQAKLYRIADNKLSEFADWDEDMLKEQLADLEKAFPVDVGDLFSDDELEELLVDKEEIEIYEDHTKGILSLVYGVPPFSILDTRKETWQNRKRYWMDLIEDKGESREHTLKGFKSLQGAQKSKMPTVSILDPVLSEIIVKWFGNKEWNVFDPFAGDSVFGYVSAAMGMNFTGIELRQEQVNINSSRTEDLPAKYICDNSLNASNHIELESQDLIFSCPPYADLEVYSDNPEDLSTMNHEEFFDVYSKILTSTYKFLKQNRFAVITIGEVRNKKTGEYIGLIPKTIQIMQEAGYKFWNEIILINSVGSLAIRVGNYMKKTRKVGKCHQNVLVFFKGNQEDIRNEFPEFKEHIENED